MAFTSQRYYQNRANEKAQLARLDKYYAALKHQARADKYNPSGILMTRSAYLRQAIAVELANEVTDYDAVAALQIELEELNRQPEPKSTKTVEKVEAAPLMPPEVQFVRFVFVLTGIALIAFSLTSGSASPVILTLGAGLIGLARIWAHPVMALWLAVLASAGLLAYQTTESTAKSEQALRTTQTALCERINVLKHSSGLRPIDCRHLQTP